MDFQQTIFQLKSYWAERGCIIQEPYDVEVGAGTMCPETFLRVLGPKPYRVAHVKPSRRGTDGRYCENPNRLYKQQEPYDAEVGAGTMCPDAEPKPYRLAYVQPSRSAHWRYSENPNRLYKHQQLQVILKPSPALVRQAL